MKFGVKMLSKILANHVQQHQVATTTPTQEMWCGITYTK